MAKKRKTRKEKEAVRKHTFHHLTANSIGVVSEGPKPGRGSSQTGEAKPQIASYVIADLKKVTVIGLVIIGLVLVMWGLVHYTDVFDSFFGLFNINY